MTFKFGSFVLIVGDSVSLYGPRLRSGTTLWFADPWDRARFLRRYPECADRAEHWPLTRALLAFRQLKRNRLTIWSWLKARPAKLAGISDDAPTPNLTPSVAGDA